MHKLRVAFVIDRLGVVDLLSVPQLAGWVLQRGHEAVIIEYGRWPGTALRKLKLFAPDIIAYSVCSNEITRYLQINRDIKRRIHFFSLFGGPHPTYIPSIINEDSVDAICRGEADIAFPQLLDHFGTDEMYNLPNFMFHLKDGTVRENPLVDLITDLDACPFPARELVFDKKKFMARSPIKAFMSGRGCPFDCAHCFNSAYKQLYAGKGRMMRTKSVGYLLKEIQSVRARYPLKFVRFHDDVFGYDFHWLEEFSDRFPKEVGMRFSCYLHPHMVTDKMVRLLKQAGCYAVCMAIECGNEQIRKDVLNRRVSNDEIIDSARRLKESGLRLFTFNMVGIPGETQEDILKTIRLNRRIGTDFADVSIFQPYPGTKAYSYCSEEGLLTSEDSWFKNIYSRSYLNIDPDFKHWIFVLHKLFLSMIAHQSIENWFHKLPDWRLIDIFLNLHYRLQYGRLLHKRIYDSLIPVNVQLLGVIDMLLSQNRN